MKLKVIRENFTDEYTEGKLYIDDIFFAFTIEDKVRDLNMDGDLDDEGEGKVYGLTAIPYGTYKILLVHSPKFKSLLPLLLDVKDFKGIMIHWGNTAYNSKGCILIGDSKGKGKIYNSKTAVRRLIEKMKSSKQEEWEIEIV